MALRPMRQFRAPHPPNAVPGDLNYRPTATVEQRLAHADALRERAEMPPDERAAYLTEAAGYYADAARPEQAYRAAPADGGPVRERARLLRRVPVHPRPPRRGPRTD